MAASTSNSPEPALTPARALLTPAWIGSVVLLVANDHWLKGADLLPDVLTGKLSDFAGLIVAPVLLAALLGVRSRRALLACHIAVAAVFAGIQLSPAFAGSWSALMGSFGFPWLITCDPTDLIALPSLVLAWKVLVPEMDASLPSLTPIKRSAVAALSVFGLWSTVATSQAEESAFEDTDFDDEGLDSDGADTGSVRGNLALNNASDEEVWVEVRTLRDELRIDCGQVATDPGMMLRSEAFSDGTQRLLAPGQNAPIEFDSLAECTAVWIEGERIDPTILLFETPSDYPAAWWSGGTESILAEGGLAVTADASGGTWAGGEALRVTPVAQLPVVPEACEPPAKEQRIAWSPFVSAINEIMEIGPGLPGCYAITLQPTSETGPTHDLEAWSVCVPEAAMVLSVGELIEFESSAGNSGEKVLEMTTLDPETFEDALDGQGRLVRKIRYLNGGTNPEFVGPAINRELVAVPRVDCPWQVEVGCATVERQVELAPIDGTGYLLPGEANAFSTQSHTHTAVLSHARERAVVDPACSEGAIRLSHDIDIAVIDEPLD